MKEEWDYKILDEMGSISRGRSKHRPRNDPSLFGGKYPFIQTADVKNANMYITEYSQTYNDKGLAQSKLWQPGTLCITIAANIADTGILGIPACFPDSVMGFIPFENISDVKFVKYCFDVLQKECQSIAEGTAQDNLSWEKLSRIKFPCPPLPTQQKIASILSAYDDLIENNRRQIKLLEEAALKLYKEWFVKLNFPGHETTKIADGVPDGWKKEKIDIVFDIKYGKNLPTTEIQKSGKYPVYGANGIIGYYDKKNCSQKVVLITSRGNGSGDVLCTKQKESFVTNNSFIVLPNKDFQYLDFSFNYGLMKNLDFRAIRTGSAQPQLTNNSISMLNVIIPDKNLIARYSKIGMKLYEKIDLLEIQIQQLQLARDKLLPKLMNGEIEV